MAPIRVLQFVDDKGKRLVETVDAKRIRPAPSSEAQFKTFELIQVKVSPAAHISSKGKQKRVITMVALCAGWLAGGYQTR